MGGWLSKDGLEKLSNNVFGNFLVGETVAEVLVLQGSSPGSTASLAMLFSEVKSLKYQIE